MTRLRGRTPNPEARARVAFEIPVSLRQRLLALAEARGVSMTALVREAVTRLVENAHD